MSNQKATNELVRGRKKISYEEVMQRKTFQRDIVYIHPGYFNNDPQNRYNSSIDLALELKSWIDEELNKFMAKTEYVWFDIVYSWQHDYDGSEVRIWASRHETDAEYNKRTTAWLKRQKQK